MSDENPGIEVCFVRVPKDKVIRQWSPVQKMDSQEGIGVHSIQDLRKKQGSSQSKRERRSA